MKKISIISFLFLALISSLIDITPHMQMYIKYLSIYQISDILIRLSFIILILGVISSFFNKKSLKYSIMIFMIFIISSLSIDFYNSYFELRVILKKLFLILFSINYLIYNSKIYTFKRCQNNFKVIKYFNLYLLSSIGFIIEFYEKLRLSYFRKNIFSAQNFLGLSLLIIYLFIITKKKSD